MIYRVLDIIYEKLFEDLEQLILNDSNINDMLNINQILEIKNLAFEYYKNKEQIIIIKLSQNLTYEDFIEKKCLNSNTDLNSNFENIKDLFESNKDWRNRAELKVNLKYENCDFGIPNNLYILGIISKCE